MYELAEWVEFERMEADDEKKAYDAASKKPAGRTRLGPSDEELDDD